MLINSRGIRQSRLVLGMQLLAPNKENLPKLSIVCESNKLTEECWIPGYWGQHLFWKKAL